MPLTQQDILDHYEKQWKQQSDAAGGPAGLEYSTPVEDAVLYPAYQRLLSDLGARVNGGSILDVGSGSGRWVRFFLERYRPSRLTGIDFSASAIELLERWQRGGDVPVAFRRADITDPALDLGAGFDLVNVANVLFHIPEPEKFSAALRNLARLVAPEGFIVTTEYLPRFTMRTEWMLVRSRYEFEAAAAAAGLRLAAVRGFSFFSNDPMGMDGPDTGPRRHFYQVRDHMARLLSARLDPPLRRLLVEYMTGIERAALAFCGERLADIELPSQKLVVLRRA